MPHFPHDAALAEKGLLELEAMLEKPKSSDLRKQALTQATAAYTKFIRPSSIPYQGPLKRTAYLDGLRGFAALLVYSLHHEIWGHSGVKGELILENAFGWDKKYYAVCFPGIRLLFSGGHLAVAIFFIISGYVLSIKPLTLVQARETTQLADNLGSALFRRWLRLYIPVVYTTFLWMSSWHLFNIRSGNPLAHPPEPTYFAEIWKWYCDFKNFSFLFQGEPWNAYNDHTWSIPMEFRGSIVVYASLLAFARCRRNTRLLCEAGLVYYFLYIVDGWYCGLFVMGMFLCDLDLLAYKNELPGCFYRLKPIRSWIFYALLVVSLYLGGVPSITNNLAHLRKSPGWYYLSFLKPQAVYDFRWFFRFWAATFFVISMPRIPWLKAFFETPFCQYFGRVAFGFYLVHGPVLWTLGDRLYAATGRVREGHIGIVPGWMNLLPIPAHGPFGLEMNFLIPHLVLLPFTLWLAVLVTQFFDEPSVKISQWVYKRVIDPDEPSEKTVRCAKGGLIRSYSNR